QFGCEIPFAGMNEKGLTVDLLQLNQAEFPVLESGKASVNVVQWVQYQLDTAGSVSEVVASLETIYPTPMVPSLERVHYFVTDASGDVATIAFLEGQATVTRGDRHYHCALANSTVDASLAAYRGGRTQNNSELRFCQAVKQIELAAEEAAAADPMKHARASLALVDQPELTQWSIVYEPSARKLSFSTRAAKPLRWIDLDDLDFAADAPVLIADVNADHAGDLVPHLREYTAGENERIVNFAFDQMMPSGFVRAAIKQLVLAYPATLKPAPVPKRENDAAVPAPSP
ncbi:MAG: linear amide C-N hydrolase, partial [Novipirellula sp. JB048]